LFFLPSVALCEGGLSFYYYIKKIALCPAPIMFLANINKKPALSGGFTFFPNKKD